tara:strand:+ start:2790 stop:3905 length:1116 start_codon:yes stop_codon:yes gene_type:complete
MAFSAKEPLLILGGGLIGLSIAHELASAGCLVRVLNRSLREAAGFGAAGMLAPHAEGLSSDLLVLGQLSLGLIPKWVDKIEENSGLKCELRQCGIVVPFKTNLSRDDYLTAKSGLILNRNDLEKEIPGISDRWKTGLLFNQDGQIDNRRCLMEALKKACQNLGVTFEEGIEVLDIIEENKTIQAVKIVNTSGKIEYIKAETVIISNGAWSKTIFSDLPVFPVKGQMLSIQGPKNYIKRVLFGEGIYLVPRNDGLIIVGATSEKDALFTKGTTTEGQFHLKQGLIDLLPIAKDWPQKELWWGFRPCTPDKKPILGSSSIKGLWVATGHYRNGVLLSAITADLLTKCILGKQLKEIELRLLAKFSLNRFAKKE